MKNSLFKNTIYKSILSFVNIVIPILVGPYIVKLLDVDLYGTYNIVYSEIQVFLVFASFGLYTYGMRELSKIRDNKDKISRLFTNLFCISIISNLLVGIAYILYSLFTSSGVTLSLYLIMGIQFIANAFYIEFINEALENYSFITIKSIIVKVIYIILIFLFVVKPDDIVIYAFIIAFTVFLNNIISFIYAKKYIKFNFKNIKFKKYLKPLTTILIIGNLDLLYSQLDRIMLGKFVGGIAVTTYYIPYFLVSTLVSIPYSIIVVSIPRLSYIINNESKWQYEFSLNKIISTLMFIVVPVCMGVFVLANEVILLYAGEKYLACIPVLMVACIMRIIISLESVSTNLIMYPNNCESKILKFSLFCGAMNLVFNFLLVIFNIFTPMTAMLTTMIAEALLFLLQYFYSKNTLKINVKVFNRQNIIYFLLGLTFIPISMFIKHLNLNFHLTILSIILLCTTLYVVTLLFLKDENIILVFHKISKKFLRRELK